MASAAPLDGMPLPRLERADGAVDGGFEIVRGAVLSMRVVGGAGGSDSIRGSRRERGGGWSSDIAQSLRRLRRFGLQFRGRRRRARVRLLFERGVVVRAVVGGGAS